MWGRDGMGKMRGGFLPWSLGVVEVRRGIRVVRSGFWRREVQNMVCEGFGFGFGCS